MAEGPKRAPGRKEAVPSKGHPRMTAELSAKEALDERYVVSMKGSFISRNPKRNLAGRRHGDGDVDG
jgi:hypothetical protein